MLRQFKIELTAIRAMPQTAEPTRRFSTALNETSGLEASDAGFGAVCGQPTKASRYAYPRVP